MCLSEKISWTTLIIGTIINVISIIYLSRIKNKNTILPIVIILAWQYALFMQIPDALKWKNPEAIYPGKLAYLLNVTQPLIVIILMSIALSRMNISLNRLVPAIISCVIYSVFIIKEAYNRTDFDITPEQNCRNLNYKWWSNIPVYLYFITIILAFFAIPSLGYLILSIFLFLVSILITSQIVGNNCNAGSLWCWSVAGSGFCTILYYLIVNRN